MASLFSALLPDHLKEKLGMRAKERDKVKSIVRKPLATNNTTPARLSTELRSQVQSPGFTSRLSSLARNENSLERNNLSPRYSMVGNLTNVGLRNQTLPKLENRRISRGSPNVTVRLAPSDPFSPFKRRQSSEPQNRERNVEEESKRNISSDPRSVIAVLAELSKKRKTINDDQSETGSKRARRDSSSSIGSSLSMEMPPLFSSGVVGQTTSHLVNREADLSLGSLLSRNQSMFGHTHTSSGLPSSNVTLSTSSSNSSAGGPAIIGQAGGRHSLSRDVTTTAISHINNYNNITTIASGGYRGTAVNAVKRINNTTAGPVGESVRAEMLASLSSSRCMLQKRKRGDDSEEDSDSDSSEFQLETPKPKRINNSFRFGGDSVANGSRKQSRDSSRRSSRQSSDGSPGATPIRGDRSSTPAKEGPVLVLPLPADMIRPLSKVKNDKARMVTKEDLNKERSLQKKRLDKLLKAFDDDSVPDNKVEQETKEDTATSTPSQATITSTAGGSGFAFNLGKPVEGQIQNSAAGFTFDLNKKDEKDGAGSSNTKEDDTNKPVDDKTKPATEESATKAKPHTVTFSEGSDDNKSATPSLALEDPKSAKNISSILKHKGDGATTTASGLTAVGSGLSTSSAPSNLPDIAKISSPPSAVAAFTFGKTTATVAPATADSSSATAPPPAYSFGSTSAVKPASTTQENTVPAFSFGSSKPEANKLAAPLTTLVNPGSSQPAVPSFGLPAVKAAAEAAPASKQSTTGFSFGAGAANTPVTTAATASATFSFGASAAKPVPEAAPATTAAAKTAGAFSFGGAPKTTSATTPAFQFGGSAVAASSTPQSTTTASVPSFQFGAASTTTAPKAAATAAFSFGAAAAPAPATTATPSFAFGSTAAKANDSFAFGGAASTGSQPSTGSVPAKSSMFQFGGGGASSQSSASGTNNTVAPAATSGSAFTFGKTTGAEPAAAKPVFGFGGVDSVAKKDGDNNSSSLFSFGGKTAAGAAPAFGAAPATTKATSSFGSSGALPTFGAASSSSTTFGAAAPAFGNPAPSADSSANVFGASSGAASAASPFGTPANNLNAGGMFSFGKQEQSKPAVASSPFSFGGGATQPTKPAAGAFSFGGASTPQQPAASQNTAAASPFAFGGGSSSQVAAPGVSSTTGGGAAGSGMFTFGGAAPSTTGTAQQNSKAGFNFGQAAAVQSPPAQNGMFQFGGAPSAPVAASPFGNPVQQNAAPSPFGAPAPSFAPPAAQSPPGGGNMFSIGAGSSQNRASQQPRKYATARRTRK